MANALERELGQVAAGVARAARFVEAIAGASRTQLAAAEEVRQAVTSIEDVSQANANGARDSAAVAASLSAETQTLATLVQPSEPAEAQP